MFGTEQMTRADNKINLVNIKHNPDQNSKTQSKKQLKKKTIEILLNELFALDNQ